MLKYAQNEWSPGESSIDTRPGQSIGEGALSKKADDCGHAEVRDLSNEIF